MSAIEQHVDEVPTVAAIAVAIRDAVVAFNRVRNFKRLEIFHGQSEPVGMRHCQEGARVHSAPSNTGARIALSMGLEIQRQADRKQMPKRAALDAPWMQFSADKRGEVIAAEVARIADCIAVALHAVVGQRDEVVSVPAIHPAVFGRAPVAIGVGRMPVQIAAVEAAGLREGEAV